MKEQLKQMIIDSIQTWTDKDIYVVSLYVYDDDDNPCKPTVTLGYNTETRYKEALKTSDEGEARWNFAVWLQNDLFCFGADNDTAKVVKEWVIDQGFEYYDDFISDFDFDDDEADDYDDLTGAFIQVLIEIVRELHEEKVLTKKYGRELPILIHELEYYDVIAEQNIEANGEDLVKDFSKWIYDMYIS
ncbi:MAG: hypothetical protein K6E53_01505 [Lachnospiraceae bacterium]|nr:hypothetical protein [Lachnospiraceae bacterium]